MSATPTPDVCLISPYPPRGERHGGHSGVASYTANLAHALDAAGADVAVVAPHAPGEPERSQDGSIAIHRAFANGSPAALPQAALAAHRTGAPSVHLQHETFLYGGPASVAGLAPALAGLRRRRGGSVVTTMHHVVDPRTVDADFVALHRVSAPVRLARAGMAAIRGSIRRLSDAVVVHEPGFAAVVDGSRVVPHGVEPGGTTGTAGADAAAAAFKRRHGLDDGRLVVLCFGFVAPYKGLERVLDAGRLARESVHVVVAGGEHPRMAGPNGYANELRNNYQDIATFTGRVPDADVAACFGAADVAAFLYPQPVSASGALALALAHRTPIVVSRELAGSAGVPDALVAPGDDAALAARLRDLAHDSVARAALRDVAAELLDGRTWPAVARRHLDLYEEVARA